jgi:hypothetical protein
MSVITSKDIVNVFGHIFISSNEHITLIHGRKLLINQVEPNIIQLDEYISSLIVLLIFPLEGFGC